MGNLLHELYDTIRTIVPNCNVADWNCKQHTRKTESFKKRLKREQKIMNGQKTKWVIEQIFIIHKENMLIIL